MVGRDSRSSAGLGSGQVTQDETRQTGVRDWPAMAYTAREIRIRRLRM